MSFNDRRPGTATKIARDSHVAPADAASLRRLSVATGRPELAAVLEALDAPLYLTDGEGRVTMYNQAAVELWGRKPVPGTTLWCGSLRIFRPDGSPLPFEECPMAIALRESRAVSGEEIIIERPDGTRRRVLPHPAPVRDATGTVIGAVNLLLDITDRSIADNDAAHLAAIVAFSDDAIISKDLDGVITTWNEAATRLFGYTAEEALGQPVTMLIPDDHIDEEPMIIGRIMDGERVEHYETVRRRKDGALVEVSLTVSPIRDTEGRIIGASKIARDITERKRIEATLRDVDRRKDEFLAMLGHELRSPLAPIRNVTEVLRRQSAGSAVDRQMFSVLVRQVEHMARLLDDLLDVGRITQGKIRIRKEPLELMAVVARATELSRPNIELRRHRLRVALPEVPVRIRGDLTRLVQMLSNLLNNAAKYTPEGGEITLTAERDGSTVAIRVADNGTGIAPEILPRIFDLFSQADRTLERADGGLGIGLTLVQRIAQLHGGTVDASSDGPGRGSTFRVTLPILSSAATGLSAGADGSKTTTPSAPKRILIVDDNADSADSMAVLLRLSGHEAVTAADGVSALEIAKSFGPHAVVLDIGLPGMDGYEVARQLRREKCPATLIALTGYGQPEDLHRSQQAGFDHHLVKPVDPDALERILNDL